MKALVRFVFKALSLLGTGLIRCVSGLVCVLMPLMAIFPLCVIAGVLVAGDVSVVSRVLLTIYVFGAGVTSGLLWDVTDFTSGTDYIDRFSAAFCLAFCTSGWPAIPIAFGAYYAWVGCKAVIIRLHCWSNS